VGGIGGPGGVGGWDANRWGGNRGVWGNNTNIRINNNFRHNNNFAGNPNCWGGHPWWGAGNSYNWHHGHWGHGWNGGYWNNHWWFDDDVGEGFMWGIAAWSLGSMIYDMGYESYSNPYPAPPVENTTVVYTQPMSVSAAANPPGDENTVAAAEEKSQDALETSRAAFKTGDYTTALRSADEAIAATPDDVTLHEYRALILFALGRYGDAAGVLNPVLASGPGWSWETMVGFYSGTSTYEGQLRKLESWVDGSTGKAEGHFLLGYHYLVCGYMEKAYEQFDKTVQLQPADGVARQLRDLTKNSLPDDGDPEGKRPPRPDPVPKEKLIGIWTSDATGGKITFKLEADDKFTWSFTGSGQTSEMKGTWGINDKGLVILNAENSQMVTAVSLEGDTKMKFLLVGGPDGDPGLSFTKN
jgi:tetratricopeptide (TPR) repeat protein